MRNSSDLPKALIFTAIPAEYAAIRRILTDVEEVVDNLGTLYEHGRHNGEHQEWDVWIIQTGPGADHAAAEVERGLQNVGPEVTFFVGVAGGIKDVRLGDVVVANKVYNYESGKDRLTFEPRPDLYPASYRLLQRAIAVSRTSDWVGLNTTKKESTPRAIVGPVATGEKVIASRKSQTHTFIKTYYGDALAVDMESHAHMLSAHAHAIPALVIRGISDLVASKKESDQAGWQERAAANAAAFMFSVLSKLERTTLKNDRIIAPFIGWETIDSLLNTLYRDIEKNFAPDFVITMSGPGSFAACYCMGLNLRDIAVLFATTFPRRDTPNSAQQTFRELAEQSGWFHIATDKWDVYLPNVLRLLPKGSKVLIFDDRVISGETQRKLKSKLEEFDYDVRCAAMLTGDDVADQLDFIGSRVNNDYIMPWGRRRGRT